MPLLSRTLLFLIVAAAAVATTACEDTVDPILDSDRQFTLWGTLDMNADVQVVRVIPIRGTLERSAGDVENVEMVSVELETGKTVAWRDSAVTFRDGTRGTLFLGPVRVRPQHTYRLELRAPDLPFVTTAETVIPPLPVVTIMPEEVTSTTSPGGALVRGSQRVEWTRIRREPLRVEQWYRFIEFGNLSFVDVILPFDPPVRDLANDTLRIRLDLKRHRDSLAADLSLAQLKLAGLGMSVTILDDAFVPPGGVFDPDVLVQPGTMSNVEHGFGFVGSVGRFSVEWVLSDDSARILGYSNVTASAEPRSLERRIARLSHNPWEVVREGS